MAKFKTGFLLGVVAGTLTGLLTAQKTGRQRTQAIADYFNGLTSATKNVDRAVARFGNAVAELQQQVTTTLKPNLAAINASVTDYNFQASARADALNEHLDVVADGSEKLKELKAAFDGAAEADQPAKATGESAVTSTYSVGEPVLPQTPESEADDRDR